MNKLYKGIILAIVGWLLALSGFLVSTLLPKPLPPLPPLGNIASLSNRSVASSSGTYFGISAEVRTATATLLTLTDITDIETVALNIQSVSTTTTAYSSSFVYVLPQISQDASSWFDLNANTIDTTGGNVRTLTLNDSSTTILAYPTRERGTTGTNVVLKNLVGRFMRFQVWTSGTSTVLLQGVEQVRQGR